MACISKGRSAWARQLCPSRGSTLASRSSSRLGTLRCPFPSRSEPAGSACTTAQARWRQGSVTTAARGGTAGQRGSGQRAAGSGAAFALGRCARCAASPEAAQHGQDQRPDLGATAPTSPGLDQSVGRAHWAAAVRPAAAPRPRVAAPGGASAPATLSAAVPRARRRRRSSPTCLAGSSAKHGLQVNFGLYAYSLLSSRR